MQSSTPTIILMTNVGCPQSTSRSAVVEHLWLRQNLLVCSCFMPQLYHTKFFSVIYSSDWTLILSSLHLPSAGAEKTLSSACTWRGILVLSSSLLSMENCSTASAASLSVHWIVDEPEYSSSHLCIIDRLGKWVFASRRSRHFSSRDMPGWWGPGLLDQVVGEIHLSTSRRRRQHETQSPALVQSVNLSPSSIPGID